jgi:hypothetical protein
MHQTQMAELLTRACRDDIASLDEALHAFMQDAVAVPLNGACFADYDGLKPEGLGNGGGLAVIRRIGTVESDKLPD